MAGANAIEGRTKNILNSSREPLLPLHGKSQQPVTLGRQAPDLRAESAEFLFDVFVASIDVIDAIDDGFAIRHERREQIGNLHGATMLTLKALHVVPLAFGPQRDSEADIGAMRRAWRYPQTPAVGLDD